MKTASMAGGLSLQSQLAAHGPILSALGFAFCSILMTVFNKSILSSWHFDGPLTLTAAQSLATILLLFLGARIWPKTVCLPSFDAKTALAVLPLSVIFVLKLSTSMLGLGKTNVPMFTCLRQTAVLFVIVEERILLGHWPASRYVWVSTAMICGGALLAAAQDASYDPQGYAYLFAANLTASLYAVGINWVKKRTGLDVVGLLAYNSLLTFPLLVVLAGMLTSDFDRAVSYTIPEGKTATAFAAVFISAILLSTALNFALFSVTTLTNATTKTVISGLKSAATTLLGLFLFTDYHYRFLNAVGLLIAFCGGVHYSSISFSKGGGSNPGSVTGSIAPELAELAPPSDSSSVAVMADGTALSSETNGNLLQRNNKGGPDDLQKSSNSGSGATLSPSNINDASSASSAPSAGGSAGAGAGVTRSPLRTVTGFTPIPTPTQTRLGTHHR